MKPILINLDLKNNSYEDIELKQGCQDTLIATITDMGDNVDLTGQVIAVEMLKADETFIIQTNDITVSTNKVTIKLNKDFTRVKGKTKLQIKMAKSGVISGSWVVVAWVRESAIDKAIGESGNIVTIKEELDNTIVKATEENKKTQDLIATGGAATKGQVAELGSDLAEKASKDDVARISSGTPLFASSVAGMTNTTKNYVNITDGFLYRYNGTSFEKTTVRYQSTGIDDKSLSLIKLKDIYQFGKNIYNKEGLELNSILINTGATQGNSAYKTSNFIDVDASTDYVISSDFECIRCYYDENKIFISYLLVNKSNSNNGTLITSPSNAKYIRVTTNNLSTYAQIEKGKIKTAYEEPTYKIDTIKIPTNNLIGNIQVDKIEQYVNGKNLINEDEMSSGAFDQNGGEVSSTIYNRTDYIGIIENTYYTLTISSSHWKVYYDAQKKVISSSLKQPTENITEQTPANAKYIRLAINKDIEKNIMLEKGIIKTEYEPFGFTFKYLLGQSNSTTNEIKKEVPVTNKLNDKMSKVLTSFWESWKLKDKDLCVVMIGDSLSTSNYYCSAREDAKTRPPLMIEESYPTFIEEVLRWEGQEYARFDVDNVFTELANTKESKEEDLAWGWVNSVYKNNRPSLTRVLEGLNCEVSYSIPLYSIRCDFIYCTDYLNAPNATVIISLGNDFVQVFDETTNTWVEANGYTYSAKELDEIKTYNGQTFRENIYQKRLKMRTTILKNNGNIVVKIKNNGQGRLNYWGIQHSPRKFFIDFIAGARGGHNISKLRNFERVDLDCFKPNLILKQSCTNNENIFIASQTDETPINRAKNTPIAMAQRFLSYVNDLENKPYKPEVVNYTLTHCWSTMWYSQNSDKVLSAYCDDGNRYTGFDYHDYLDAFLISNGKKVLPVWRCLHEECRIKAKNDNLPIMQSVFKASNKQGSTWTYDGTHHNDLGARVIFNIMQPFFVN